MDELLDEFLAAGRGETEADQSVDNPEDRRVAFRFDFLSEDLGHLATELGLGARDDP